MSKINKKQIKIQKHIRKLFNFIICQETIYATCLLAHKAPDKIAR